MLINVATAAYCGPPGHGAGAADAAATAPDTVYVVKPIVVEARRDDPRLRLFDGAGFITTVDVHERKDRVEDLAQVLSRLVGVKVKQYGGLGSFATLSIRGSSASQVAIFVDGVPVGDPYLGVTNLSDLPLGSVQTIEVFRGVSPAEYGPGAIGGAVNLITRDDSVWRGGDGLAKLEARTSIGSFGTQRQQGSLWAQREFARLFVHAGRTETDGDFAFLDDNDTPFNAGDDQRVYRANNALSAWNTLARAELVRDGTGEVSFSQEYFEREQGVPGRGTYQSATAHGERRRRLSHLEVKSEPFFARSVSVGATGYYVKSVERFTDADADVGLVTQDTDNTILSYGARAGLRWVVPFVPLAVEVSHEGRKEQFHPVDRVPQLREGPDRWRATDITSVVAELYLFGDRVVLSGVQRFTRMESEFYDSPPIPVLPPQPRGRITERYRSPSGGVQVRAARWLTLKGNVGRYYRLPTFLELFGNTGSVTGNGELAPESGLNRDAGAVATFARAGRFENTYIEVSYLDNTVDDLILFFPNSQYTSKPVNIGSAEIQGWEFVASTTWSGTVDVAVSYARLDTKDTGEIPYYNGNELPSRPRDAASVTTGVRWKSWRTSWEYHHIGANYLDRYNTVEVPARHLHNLVLESRFPAGFALTLELRNLTDNNTSDVAGYPLPGRALYSTLTYRFAKENQQ